MKNKKDEEFDLIITEKYEIRRRIGYGVHGPRYLAFPKQGGKRVTIKQIPKHAYSEQEIARIAKGIQMHMTLKHKALCKIVEMIETEQFIYVVTSFVEGRTLQSIVASEGSLPHDEVVIILRQIAELIAYLHEKAFAILYCDIRPVNFIYTPEGGIVVIDFEGAMLKSDSRRFSGSYPGFSAPEQIRGEQLDERTDVFGVGALAFYLLTGHMILDGVETYSTLVGYYEPTLVGTPLETLIDKCLSEDPMDRPQDARELINGLSQIKRVHGMNFILQLSDLARSLVKRPQIVARLDTGRPYDVFISYHHKDKGKETKDFQMAMMLYLILNQMGVNAFFSYKNANRGDYGGDFTPAIYNALEEASILIVVGTRREYLKGTWIEREVNTFQGLIDNRPEKKNNTVFCYLGGSLRTADLPANLINKAIFTDINELVKVVCDRLSKPLVERAIRVGGMDQFYSGIILAGRYILEKEIERNNDESLFMAHDNHLDQKVMVRICPGEEQFYRREYEILAKAGPLTGIPHITDKDEYNGYVYYVTEYLSGPSLAVLLSSMDHFAETNLRYWMIQILTILNNMHSQEIPLYHGNIKLSTVIVNNRQISLTSPHISASGNSARSDIKAVGEVMSHLASRNKNDGAISKGLSSIIEKCISTYKTCDEAIRDLERL